jgi:hypothetical protein
MAFSVQINRFRFGEGLWQGVAGKRVLITGAGKDGGLGQAIDPGVSAPGYVISNWAVLQLPKVLAVNLGRSAKFITASPILLPFVRTGMTSEQRTLKRKGGRDEAR